MAQNLVAVQTENVSAAPSKRETSVDVSLALGSGTFEWGGNKRRNFPAPTTTIRHLVPLGAMVKLQKYTFVTVVFEAEYELLLMQARSMAMYCPLELIELIVIIDNFDRPLSRSQLSRIKAEYRCLAGIVQFIRSRDLADIPQTGGWRSQQVLKLMVANVIRSERYVVLDAKNHLVFSLKREFLEAPDGRARINRYSYRDHPLRNDLERVLNYLGVEPGPHVEMFTATVAPFVIYTGIVLDLIREMEARVKEPFPSVFVSNQLTEFFLYTGYIVKCGIDLKSIYDFHQLFCPIVWAHTADKKGCLEAVTAANEQRTPFFAVHRLAIRNLSNESRVIIADFWKNRDLFKTKDTASIFLVKLRRKLLLYSLRQYVRRLPPRIKSRALRLRQSLFRVD
jgi:hypothetical protein